MNSCGGSVMAVAVLGGEANAVGIDALQALIGDTDAVRVAAEVAEDLLRPAERALGVDDPLDAVELSTNAERRPRQRAAAWLRRTAARRCGTLA